MSLLQLGNLDLFPELLKITLLTRFSACLLASCLVVELLLNPAHVFVRLDHLGKVVSGTSERHTLFLQHCARAGRGRLADLVEGQFAVQVIVGVRDFDLFLRDQRVVLGEGRVGRDERDALEGGVDRGGVVDCETLMGDDILAFVFG